MSALVTPSDYRDLPRLGVGASTEAGTRPSLDPVSFAVEHPGLIDFVEYGSDVDRGLDASIRGWVAQGGAATYHFLDVNLEEESDLDDHWLSGTRRAAEELGAPWICGDSGLWHFGPRDQGHGLLLPPILTRDSAEITARGVRHIREQIGKWVLPEHPPSLYFLGDLHILDYFRLVSELSEGPILLDLAHLAIFQRAIGASPTSALERVPFDSVVEIHVAGGGEVTTEDGFSYLEDDHRSVVHDDVWALAEAIIPRCPNLKAIVFECEHNPPDRVVSGFERLHRLFGAASC